VFVHNSYVLVILLSHGNEGFFLHLSISMVQSHNQLARWYITNIIGAYSKNIYVFDKSSSV